ncbi:MAG: lysophospholipid acyltransferase family protein [Bacteroidales bacterium]|jgi:1-acyl-sn-glycerol-3-phosphate acyltransferase
MISGLSHYILRLFGWETSAILPEGIVKAVVIVAPHTSYWDFVIGRMTFWSSKLKIRVLIKKEVFVFPLGGVLRKLGGVPVARGKKNNLVEQVIELFQKNQTMVVVITPEGTRKRVRHWKKGFYYIAMEAKVPIALGFIDYGTRTGGIGPLLYPSGNYEKDLAIMMDFYRNKKGLHPEQFNSDSFHTAK